MQFRYTLKAIVTLNNKFQYKQLMSELHKKNNYKIIACQTNKQKATKL